VADQVASQPRAHGRRAHGAASGVTPPVDALERAIAAVHATIGSEPAPARAGDGSVMAGGA
jgi:hypothetical protein